LLGKVYECIYSPCSGRIDKVLTGESNHVYEWEKLFVIKKNNGSTEEISVGISGHITSLHVKEGEVVKPLTVLATIQDDLIITGSD
jgi:biotin carboxyl carrier protein